MNGVTDQYAEAREVVRRSEEWAHMATTSADDARVTRLIASAYLAGYRHCAQDAGEYALKIARGAGVKEPKPAPYFERSEDRDEPDPSRAWYDTSAELDSQGESNNATASPPPEGQLVLRPDAIEVLRAVRPSREAVAFLVGLTRESLANGKTDEACETLALALCMRELAR